MDRIITKNVVKSARKKTGLNQSEFGFFLGCQISTVSRYERGLRIPTRNYFEHCKAILKLNTNQVRLIITHWKKRQNFRITDTVLIGQFK